VTPKCEVIICWSDEDQAFIAEVPELPGCAADAETYQEALANAEVVIQEWIETAKNLGLPHPLAKRPTRLRLNLAVSAAASISPSAPRGG
jgi:predicted RNase H-like HicB family nuclease